MWAATTVILIRRISVYCDRTRISVHCDRTRIVSWCDLLDKLAQHVCKDNQHTQRGNCVMYSKSVSLGLVLNYTVDQMRRLQQQCCKADERAKDDEEPV